ncbi:transcription cofactor vestigial-like protein 3 [Schistocerca gregaria]|uniref:transcription cofactor vestigial-like protein 3 n=1 Tax=Schistocerca gregaria TaxID=7010 RepID=UPI00211DE85C|nr:transcription cofactor vestigial-like protein 3 [Schistocerca gregaria]XP_049855624.1 transcription cofactor vestigial-like protein 3 [Schistocerca gregaria]
MKTSAVIVMAVLLTVGSSLPVEQEAVREPRSPLPRHHHLHLHHHHHHHHHHHNNPHGDVSVGVSQQPGVGTLVGVSGHGSWTSGDGHTHVNAGGSWDRVFHGPGATHPHVSGGISITHEFGRRR